MTAREDRVSQRATRAIVDLDAIAGNVRAVRAAISSNASLMAVVKGNAYGHGARMVAETAIEAGAVRLGVATLDEALVLREHGIAAPIAILGPISLDEIEDAAANRIEISVGSLEFAAALARCANLAPLSVHLKIDTGLRRFGVMPDQAVAAMRHLTAASTVEISGVFTHFGQADETNPAPTERQAAAFRTCLAELAKAGLERGIAHASNSAGLLRYRSYDFGMVRLGISLYGIAPSAETALLPGMKPALTLVSRVQRTFDLASGDGVSYGATYRADEPRKAALVPVGYADGYPRSLSNRGEMNVNGDAAPVLGRVCMDQTVIGLADDSAVVVNNPVTIAGGIGADSISFETVAERAGTNAYEIVTAISARVPRFYTRHGILVAVEDLGGLHLLR